MGVSLVPLLAGFVIALGGAVACARLARRAGLVVQPREDRWHRRPVPLLGGLAIMAGTLAGLAFVVDAPGRFGPFVLIAVLMGSVGLFDDVWSLRPQTKLLAQIALAALLVQLGFLLRLTDYPWLNVLLTLFWVVGITNAFNLLDNMDGLAAGMAVLAGAFRLTFFVMDGDPVGVAVTAAFVGACAGFLVRNFPPARLFMGDSGSLFVGFFLSGVCLVGDYAYSRGIAAVLAFPVLLTLIPIFDTTFVTLTRLATGRPVAQGGRDHTSHRLLSLGVTERQTLAILYGISVLSGVVAVLSYGYGFSYTVVPLGLLVVGLLLFGVHLGQVSVEASGARSDATAVRLVADFPYKRQVATVAVDVVLILVAYYSAYLLRFEQDFAIHQAVFLRTVGPVIVFQLAALALSGAYHGLWRYTSLPELLILVRGATIGVAACVVVFVFATRFAELSRAVFVLDWLLLVVLLGASRVSFRLFGEILRPGRRDLRRVLIYGAGDGGALVLRELRANVTLGREPVGFLDDDPGKAGTRLHEVPVLGGVEQVEQLLGTHGIQEVVVSSRKIPPERLERLETACSSRGVAVAHATLRIE